MRIYNYKEITKISKRWYSVMKALPPIGTEVIVFRER